MYCEIRNIAITNCPFRFTFGHLPRCGQLLRLKQKTTLHEIRVHFFLSFSDSKSIRVVNLRTGLACCNR